MLEAVFGDSVKGAMKFAMGGGNVVCIGFALDVGDISGGVLGEGRRRAYDLLWGRFAPFHGGEAAAERERYFNELEKDLQRLMDTAEKGDPVRIWPDRSPASVCGLYAVCHALRHIDCPIYLAEMPEFEPHGENGLRAYSGWGELEPKAFAPFAERVRELHPMAKRVYADRWAELAEQNAPLRAMVNGELMSVPEDFYDHLIERYIPEGEFVMARLIGRILGKHPIGVGDSWYACRIDRMIAGGKLRLMGHRDKTHPYGAVLTK